MSDETGTRPDPFATTAIEEEVELRALARVLEIAEGFKLILARCNQPVQRQKCMEALRERVPQIEVQEVHFDEPVTHLLDELRARLAHPRPGAVFVSGLEHSLRGGEDVASEELVANLNASRNSFPSVLSCPLVLWVPEYVLTAIAQGAPDFFSIRSGVYHFVAAPQETRELLSSLTIGASWQTDSLSADEKQERIEAIQSLLEDYRAQPRDRRDRRAEARLLDKMGVMYDAGGDYDRALECFQQNLLIRGEVGDRAGEGIALVNIGRIYRVRGDYGRALEYSQQSLEIAQEIGHRAGEADTLNSIAMTYKDRGDYDDALKYLEQCLGIVQEIGDRANEAATLNNIAVAYQDRGDYDDALKYLEQCLKIVEEIGHRAGQGAILSNIGRTHVARGDYHRALKYVELSLAIKRAIGDRAGLIAPLHSMAVIHLQNEEIEAAAERLREAFRLATEMQHAAGMYNVGRDLGHLLCKIGQKDEGLRLLRQSIDVGKRIGASHVQAVEELLEELAES